jgi:hypothetical protein
MKKLIRFTLVAAMFLAAGDFSLFAESYPPIRRRQSVTQKKAAAKKAAPAAKAAPEAGGSGRVLDSFDVNDWVPANHEKCTISVTSAPGKVGSALKITYDLKDSHQWVALGKTFNIPALHGQALEFWLKGTGAANTLEIKMVDEDGSNFGVKKTGLTKTDGWTKVTLNDNDFTYWWGGDNTLQGAHDIQFAISAGEGGAGEIMLDELKVVPAKVSAAAAAGLLDDGESVVDWSPAHADGGNISLATESGQKGKALAITYDFPQDQWVAVRKKISAPLKPSSVFSFSIKGTGPANNFEFKVVDKDGSVFGKTMNGLAGNGSWQEISVPLSDLQYLWGGDNQLDLANTQFLDIAISGSGGSGKVLLDEIRVR